MSYLTHILEILISAICPQKVIWLMGSDRSNTNEKRCCGMQRVAATSLPSNFPSLGSKPRMRMNIRVVKVLKEIRACMILLETMAWAYGLDPFEQNACHGPKSLKTLVLGEGSI